MGVDGNHDYTIPCGDESFVFLCAICVYWVTSVLTLGTFIVVVVGWMDLFFCGKFFVVLMHSIGVMVVQIRHLLLLLLGVVPFISCCVCFVDAVSALFDLMARLFVKPVWGLNLNLICVFYQFLLCFSQKLCV